MGLSTEVRYRVCLMRGVRVRRRGFDELLDRRHERLVGVVHDDVRASRGTSEMSGAASPCCARAGAVTGTHGPRFSSGRSAVQRVGPDVEADPAL
jgi:hypothetical protein